jgi:hypothetical protein
VPREAQSESNVHGFEQAIADVMHPASEKAP